MESNCFTPINLGSDEMVTVNELVAAVCEAAGKRLYAEHHLTQPQGVGGRNSDNSLLAKTLGWQPQTTLAEGIKVTYDWTAAQVSTS